MIVNETAILQMSVESKLLQFKRQIKIQNTRFTHNWIKQKYNFISQILLFVKLFLWLQGEDSVTECIMNGGTFTIQNSYNPDDDGNELVTTVRINRV